MAVLLLDWDFHMESVDDPVYAEKADAARDFAKTAGSDRRELALTTWAILTAQTSAELYADFKAAVLANVSGYNWHTEDRVNVAALEGPYVGHNLKTTIAWLRKHLP